jgi:Ni,Fe-hydrogenase III small subunit
LIIKRRTIAVVPSGKIISISVTTFGPEAVPTAVNEANSFGHLVAVRISASSSEVIPTSIAIPGCSTRADNLLSGLVAVAVDKHEQQASKAANLAIGNPP